MTHHSHIYADIIEGEWNTNNNNGTGQTSEIYHIDRNQLEFLSLSHTHEIICMPFDIHIVFARTFGY